MTTECKPILEQIANYIIKVPFFWRAKETLEQFEREMPAKNKDIAELIKEIKSTRNEIKRSNMIWELRDSLRKLPLENYKVIIDNICEIVEKAIGKGDKKPSVSII